MSEKRLQPPFYFQGAAFKSLASAKAYRQKIHTSYAVSIEKHGPFFAVIVGPIPSFSSLEHYAQQAPMLTKSTHKCKVSIEKKTEIKKPLQAFQIFKSMPAHDVVVQLGGFNVKQGRMQNVDIEGLVGDKFTVTQHTAQQALIGVGYYLHGPETQRYRLAYGINALYLNDTYVKGVVFQEQIYPNLVYQYSITQYPIYAASKLWIKNQSHAAYDFTLEAGLGPNIIKTGDIQETTADFITLPDRSFLGSTQAVFSAMIGAGMQFKHAFGNTPVECGYRFLYLGQGRLSKSTDQLLTSFNTGQTYANAILCTASM